MTALNVQTRDLKAKVKRLRREGFITGNVLGKQIEGSIPVQIAKKE